MAVISFLGNDDKETGQTITTVSIASVMAMEHNIKNILIGTDFNDKTMNNCFWAPEENSKGKQSIFVDNSKTNVGTISGIEGLASVVTSGRVGNNIIGNYAKPVFKDNRLDVLAPPETSSVEKYNELCKNYPAIIKMAKSDYNLAFVDINKNVPYAIRDEILQNSDIIVVGIRQSQASLMGFLEAKSKNPIFNQSNVMLAIGKYDGFSKYNIKNVERYYKGKHAVIGIPYNTLFFEAVTEGRAIDYFLGIRGITNPVDKNYVFLQQNRYACEMIMMKIKELQLR